MYNIISGNIIKDVLYIVYGTQNVTYNGVLYESGQVFKGVASVVNFTFSGSGTQLVYEVTELKGSSIIFDENSLDYSFPLDITTLSGFGIEYLQNTNDITFSEATILKGFSVELIDYPFYSFMITQC